jgi:methylase of polypeptide subunit release factors
MPLLLDPSPQFAVLREYLRGVGFNAESICQSLNIPELPALLTRHRKRVRPPGGNDELSVLIRLLLMGESIEKRTLEANLPVPVIEALTKLGLMVPDTTDAGHWAGSVVLYPVGALFIVSDRWFAPDGKDYRAPDDIVYPAITPNTAEFMATLPVAPCGNFLELCSGTGAVALAASSYATNAWAVDITARSTEMAEFNRLLNGCDNVTVAKGDLYEGLEGLKFDRIVAHPPYMPALGRAQIFYDGGADGEQITRRCIEGLPRYLNPGGCFYCQAQGSDRKDAPLDQRIRVWLGDAQSEFDVAVIEKRAQAPKDAAFIYALKSNGGFEAVEQMLESLSNLQVESMAYGWMIIQRKKDERKIFTARRFAGQRTGPQEIDWLLQWESFAASPSALEALPNMIPIARPSLQLRTLYRLKQGDLAPEQFTLHTDDPFSMDCNVQPWVGFLIPLCDGKLTAQQLLEACKTHSFIHAETPPEEFYDLLVVLISGGFLEVAEYPPPKFPTAASTSGTRDALQSQTF